MNKYMLSLLFASLCLAYAATECSTCINAVDFLKNTTNEGNGTFVAIIQTIEKICSEIYGPAARECVNITKNMNASISYYNHHNASDICQHFHIC